MDIEAVMFRGTTERLSIRLVRRDLHWAWLAATLFSGAPSTVFALLTGADPVEATRAAAAMLAPLDGTWLQLLMAAGIVHSAVSLFWTLAFGALLPRRHVLAWALAGSAAVALLDLRVIAPLFFPAVAALPFWPQFADHLMWGACVGLTLQFRGSEWTRPAVAPIDRRLRDDD
jgi:hypothetical protein